MGEEGRQDKQANAVRDNAEKWRCCCLIPTWHDSGGLPLASHVHHGAFTPLSPHRFSSSLQSAHSCLFPHPFLSSLVLLFLSPCSPLSLSSSTLPSCHMPALANPGPQSQPKSH